MSAFARTRTSHAARSLVVIAFGWTLLASSSLFAGSIFMKNGYIIQGPIVDRDESSYVLGWEYGKMRVHRRFVDQIVYDTGEEERLEEYERLREQDALRSQIEDTSATNRTRDSLPADLDELLRRLNQPALSELDSSTNEGPAPTVIELGNPNEEPPVETGEPVVPLGDGSGEVEPVPPVTSTEPESGSDPNPTELEPRMAPIPRPEELIVGGAERSDGGLRIGRPHEWRVRESGDLFELVSSDSEAGRASVSVVEIPRGDLELEEAFALTRDRVSQLLLDVELVSQGERQIGGEPALEHVVRGTKDGRTLQVRQVVAAVGDRLFVVSAFTDAEPDRLVTATVDACLGSIVFTAPVE